MKSAGSHNFSKPRDFTSKIGRVYHDLTVIEYCGKHTTGHSLWKCRCVCGAETTVRDCALSSGNTKSCGCRNTRNITKHGKSTTSTYKSWASMKSRCDDEKATAFEHYGGRGISYDESWKSFESFLLDMGERPHGKSLDRIDNEKGYCKENCRWATQKEQNRNRRGNRIVLLGGEKMILIEAAEKLGISFSAARYKIKTGLIEDVSRAKMEGAK